MVEDKGGEIDFILTYFVELAEALRFQCNLLVF